MMMSSQHGANNSIRSGGTNGSSNNRTVRLQGVVWKKRTGFGQLSETVGVGKSWEFRHLVLHGRDGDSTSSKLCYYAVNDSQQSENDNNEQQQQQGPRGIIDLIYERPTISASHLYDTTQPTPYSIDVKTMDALTSTETTKWKFCFEDRQTQMAWLVALNDAVVDVSVREYNARTLCVAADFKGGGGWRLYPEEDGIFESMKDSFLMNTGKEVATSNTARSNSVPLSISMKGNAGKELQARQPPPSSNSNATTEEKKSKNTTSTSTGFVDDSSSRRSSTTSQSPKSLEPASSEECMAPPTLSRANNGEGLYIATVRVYYALAVMSISIIYTHMSASSYIVSEKPLWQILLVANICIYYLILIATPLSSTKDVKDKEKQSAPDLSITNSTIGAELMREKKVPLSEVPEENATTMSVRDLKKKEEEHHRIEPLSEEEMGAHLHERWAMSAPNVDLSGSWTLVADDAFKSEYDTYLKNLGFNRITRGVACSLISRTFEETKQSDGGRKLYLKGTNPKGAWERTLVSSGFPDFDTNSTKKEGMDYSHLKSSIKTADSEDVEAEAWWESRGTVHRSWLRGSTKYGGGDHESRRYLEDGGNILVCESIFHGKNNKKAEVRWRFQRDG